jgi:hypothetical protein
VSCYVCERDGEFLGGNIVLRDADRVYGWQGAAKPDLNLGANELIHWRPIRDAIEGNRTE